ncbi:MAG: peptide ABC transporter substrate-binding protein [Chloroflexota bacterium]
MTGKTILCLVAVLILVLTGVLTGCPVVPTLPAAQPRSGGELNLYDTGPITLDPALSAEMSSHTYVTQIFSGLMTFDKALKPVPDIAERWDKSADGKTYTFYLRKDVKFHNGREVKAQDVKYSWERACLPETGSQTAGTYLIDIIGAAEMLSGKVKELSGVKIIDDYTLQVTIDAPKAYFLSKLTYSTAYVVDRQNVAAGAEWWRNPNGTGPFKLKEWQVDKLVVLERNDLYYRGLPGVERVNFKLFAGTPMFLYETGDIDVTNVHQVFIERARDKSGPFYKELTITPELSFFYLGFNCKEPPFDDVNVRRAFTMAVDRQKIIDLTMMGTVTMARGILPPGLPGYNKDISGLDFNVAEAKALLAASKYAGKLPPITITLSGWGNNIPDYIGALVQQWRQNLGVEVKVRQLEPEVFFQPDVLMREKNEMYVTGWIADYPDPQNFLDLLFHTGAVNNAGEFSDPELDAMMDRVAVEQNEDIRFKIYQEVEQKLVDRASCLPMWFNVEYTLVKPYVKGYETSPLGIPLLSQVRIEPR